MGGITVKKIISFILCAAFLIGALPMTALADEVTATTIRLEKCEGDVTVKNASGKKLTISEKMRLYNGYEISTSRKSYAYISLDGSKAIKLDASTKISVSKTGKKLEILVSSGKLLFDVSEPLEDDESLEIRTSTTITGVRGTAGYVEIVSPSESVLTLLEGTTVVTTVDPTTGEVTETTVTSGQQLSSLLTTEDEEDTITLVISNLAEEDIPGFVRTYIAENPDVQERIEENSDLDIQVIITNAEIVLELEEEEAEKEAKEIENDVNQLETDEVDALFEEEPAPTPVPDIIPVPNPGPAPAPEPEPEPEVTTYTVTFEMNGVGTAPAAQTVTEGGTVSEPTAPTAEGYTFDGWYKDAALTTPWDFETDTVTTNTTIYAKWTIKSYTVTFEMNGHGDAIEAQTINHGSTVTRPVDPTADGYTFDGWYKDAACTTAWDFTNDTVTSDTTLYAKWISHTYALDNPTTAQLITALQQVAGNSTVNTVSVTNANLQLDEAVTVPAGETLLVSSGSVTNNSALTVDGTMTMAEGTSLTNTGTIQITSANSLHINGYFSNNDTLYIGLSSDQPGYLEIGATGKVENSGTIEISTDGSSCITNKGTFNNYKDFSITTSGVFTNEGTFADLRTADVLYAVVATGTDISYVGPLSALAEWPNGSTITLGGATSGTLPLDAAGQFSIPENTVILDLNGRTIDMESSILVVGEPLVEDTTVGNAASLTIRDSAGNGKITGSGSCTIQCGDTLILESGTIENNSNVAVYPIGYASVTIDGGSVIGSRAISSGAGSGNYSNITINDGTITGELTAIDNRGTSGILTINGGTITCESTVLDTLYGTYGVIVHNGAVTISGKGGTLRAASTDILDNMNLELPQESAAVDAENYYTVDLTKDPSIWILTNPSEVQFQRVLGKNYIAEVTLTGTISGDENSTYLKLSSESDAGESLSVLLKDLTVPSGFSLTILRAVTLTGELNNYGTIQINNPPGGDSPTSDTAFLDLSKGTLNTENGYYLDYTFSEENSDRGSFIEVWCGNQGLTYRGAADGTKWYTGTETETETDSYAQITFYPLDDSTMIIPDTFSDINTELASYTFYDPDTGEMLTTVVNIATESGTLTVTDGVQLIIGQKNDMMSSTYLFEFNGTVTISNDARLSAFQTKFTGNTAVPVITVQNCVSGDMSNLDLSSCEIVQSGQETAVSLQSGYAYMAGYMMDDVTNYPTIITSPLDCVTVNTTSATLSAEMVELTAGNYALFFSGSSETGMPSSVYSSTINGATYGALIRDGASVEFYDCNISSEKYGICVESSTVALNTCVVEGGVYAVSCDENGIITGKDNEFTVTLQSPTSFAVCGITPKNSRVSALVKAPAKEQLFSDDPLDGVTVEQDEDGMYYVYELVSIG